MRGRLFFREKDLCAKNVKAWCKILYIVDDGHKLV